MEVESLKLTTPILLFTIILAQDLPCHLCWLGRAQARQAERSTTHIVDTLFGCHSRRSSTSALELDNGIRRHQKTSEGLNVDDALHYYVDILIGGGTSAMAKGPHPKSSWWDVTASIKTYV